MFYVKTMAAAMVLAVISLILTTIMFGPFGLLPGIYMFLCADLIYRHMCDIGKEKTHGQ